MSANPHTNGGLLKKALRLPDFREYAIKVDKPARTEAENTRPLGRFLRDVMRLKPWLQLCYCARSSRTKVRFINVVDPVQTAAQHRTPPRTIGPRFRLLVYSRQARHLQ